MTPAAAATYKGTAVQSRELSPGMVDDPKTSVERRRSARLELRIPVRIKGPDATGKEVDIAAEAEQISFHGARVRSGTEFRPGVEVELANAETRQTTQYRIVWVTERPEQRRWLIGLELSAGQPALWGVDLSTGSAKKS